MDLARFDYDLPASAIAQVPVEPRDAARLLVDRGPGRSAGHRTVADLPELVGAGDVIVVNDSRVLPARLRLAKPTGGMVEVLLLERRPDGRWEALVRPSRRAPPGTVLAGSALTAVVGDDLGGGRRMVRLTARAAACAAGPADPGIGEDEAIARDGEVPLPPYIHEPLADAERYQTVYARRPTSVAAPTAGLHLTTGVLDRCRAAGARVVSVELAVGLGTFQPITAHKVEDHLMHAERYRVTPDVWQLCQDASRVMAIGTTVVRALESVAASGALEGRTELFIRKGHRFAVVDTLLTNFHVPRSSLLVLVDAFVGSRWRTIYEGALRDGYRFLSFGDAMVLDRDELPEERGCS